MISLAGKVLRVNPDGSAPMDNPFFSNVNANARKVYSLGHRNSYGVTFHRHTGHLWETENGPSDNDEINRAVAGGNYGWPTVGGIANNPSFLNPILAYTPTIAPTGIIAIFENSTVYPAAYRNNLLFVDFNTGRMRRVVLAARPHPARFFQYRLQRRERRPIESYARCRWICVCLQHQCHLQGRSTVGFSPSTK